jgi:hypothetical protein
MEDDRLESEPTLQPETLDFIYEASRSTLQNQVEAATAMDSKAIQVFSVASVVIGLAAAGGIRSAPRTLGILLVLAYLVAAVTALAALWVRTFRVTDGTEQLWRRYWADPVDEIKHAAIADVAEGEIENRDLLADKRKLLGYAIGATGVESVLVGILLTWSLSS